MAQISKERLEEVLTDVISALDAGEMKEGFGGYAGLYPSDISEYDLARAVPEAAALHPLMVSLVEKLIALPQYPVWTDDEEPAGDLLCYQLALYDPQYCSLFARCLEKQDLDHEVNQNEYIHEVFEKWGACPETALLAQARINNGGQWGSDLVNELLEEYEELEALLQSGAQEDESAKNLVPVVSAEQIERAEAKEQLQQYYDEARESFLNEFIHHAADIIRTYAQTYKVAIAAWTMHLEPEENRIQFSFTDAAGNTQDAFGVAEMACLNPFHLVCSKLGYATAEEVDTITRWYTIANPDEFKKGTFTKPLKIEVN